MFLELVTEIMTELQKVLRDELAAQGHVGTGNLSKSIQFEVSEDGNEATGIMYFEDYGVYVEAGVSADRIPFGGRSGGGGTSKYIQGLVTFWEGRGLSGREALSAAFATARVHKRDGMPSRSSYQFSSTGERTGFVRTAIEDNLQKISDRIRQKFGAELELFIGQALSQQYENITVEP